MIVTGQFISIWDEGTIMTAGVLDTETGRVDCDSVDGNGFEHLIEENFEDEFGDEHEVCDECHEFILKTVMVDGIGSCLDEVEVCSNPDCDSHE